MVTNPVRLKELAVRAGCAAMTGAEYLSKFV